MSRAHREAASEHRNVTSDGSKTLRHWDSVKLDTSNNLFLYLIGTSFNREGKYTLYGKRSAESSIFKRVC